MLIKNTDGSYCKIKEIKISGLKAYVTLIIYSSIPQTSEDTMGNIHRVFSFYLKDLNSQELHKLSYNNYWIDRNNNYDNDGTNIDINMHKELILEIDITNNNQSEMQENKWLRRCNIIMMDHTVGTEVAWTSEELLLISKEIQLPSISNLQITSDSYDILHINFKYTYESQEDFNYINENLITLIEIKSVYTGELLEECEFPHYLNENTQQETLLFASINKYTEPVTIIISIKNLRGDTLQTINKFFNPSINNTKVSIKSNTLLHAKTLTIKLNHIKSIIATKIN